MVCSGHRPDGLVDTSRPLKRKTGASGRFLSFKIFFLYLTTLPSTKAFIMPTASPIPFSRLLHNFKTSFAKAPAGRQRLVLLAMCNTLDTTLHRECEKDMKAMQSAFKNIGKQFHLPFCPIAIAGKHYSWENLNKAIALIPMPEAAKGNQTNDIVIFYYSGHGFSYQNDHYAQYPQLDMRPPNKKMHFDIEFAKSHTVNIENVLNIIRMKGGKISVAIADCCNSTIPYKRPPGDAKDMWASGIMLPPKTKKVSSKMLLDPNKEICLLVASSQFGHPALADKKIGSLFTHFFTKALAGIEQQHHKGKPYIHWPQVLQKAKVQAYKESRSYDIGGGVAGKQRALFQAYTSHEINVEDRIMNMIIEFESIKKKGNKRGPFKA
jgi:hypothetical protein